MPCRRSVLGTDGKLHGYRWGLKRKQKLLEREARAARES
ncbi:MAG: methylated-DNA--[protein]-cysteine S-methyltransferase [Proteobacteria bacterium]|nr:methylated-DNA--[protein]-cysteine S-methyltransferase [Pseudomonadota bacterium]